VSLPAIIIIIIILIKNIEILLTKSTTKHSNLMNACNLFIAFYAKINKGLFHLTTHYIKQTQSTNKLYLFTIKDFPLYFPILVRGQDF